MKLRKGNKIPYMQDHSFYNGIPSGIDFSVTRASNGYDLRAIGYGVIDDANHYGNGAIYVWKSDLTEAQKKAFKKACVPELMCRTCAGAKQITITCPSCQGCGLEIK